MSTHPAKTLSLALTAGNARPTILLNEVEGTSRTRVAAVASNVFGYWLLDSTTTCDGRHVVIEANGTNGATSSIGNGDRERVQHMLATLGDRRGARLGEVAVLAHQDGFHHVPEFYARALAFIQELEADGTPCTLLGPGEQPSPSTYNVLAGDVPAVARLLVRADNHLTYLGAVVGFATNPNLLPALSRAGTSIDNLDLTFFHDGVLALLAHDKAAQQAVCEGTPFNPLWNREAATPEEAVGHVEHLHRAGAAAVVKPHATSGGTGVRIIPIGTDPESTVLDLISETVNRYGPGTESTLFPLRTFEFAQAIPLARPDGPHLWDLRLELIASPGQVTARPVMVRICPKPFSADLPHDAVVSNLSHRAASTRNILSPSALDAVRPGLVDELVAAGLAWAANAAAWSPVHRPRASRGLEAEEQL